LIVLARNLHEAVPTRPIDRRLGNPKFYDLSRHNDSHPGLFLHHHCSSAAERQER